MLVALAGCRDGRAADGSGVLARAPAADGLVTGFSEHGARHVATIVGLHDPESVQHDPGQDAYFISSIVGFGSNKDGTGSIIRIPADSLDQGKPFAESGRGGVTLNAPKGITFQGDTLWVTDIDVVRGFHLRTGQPVRVIDFAAHAPVLLNDIAAGPDGTLRVTDTGIRMVYEGNIHVGGDRIFEIGADRSVRVVAAGARLKLPNGIAWDALASRWVVVSFDRFEGEVAALGAGDSTRIVLRRGTGLLDGVEVLPGGDVLFSSWADSSVHLLSARGGQARDSRVIREVPEPADIGFDRRRGRVLIPLTVLGQVQIWQLPPAR